MLKHRPPSLHRLFLIYGISLLVALTLILVVSAYYLYKNQTEVIEHSLSLRLSLAQKILVEEASHISHNLNILKTSFILFEKERPKNLSNAFSTFTIKALAPRNFQYNAYFALDRKLSQALFQQAGYIITTHRDPQRYGTPQFYSEETFVSSIFSDPSYQKDLSEVWYHVAKRSRNVEFTSVYFDKTYMKKWLISAGLGLYQKDEFMGMVGIDLLVDEINQRLMENLAGTEQTGILFFEDNTMILLNPPQPLQAEFIGEQIQYEKLSLPASENSLSFSKLLASPEMKLRFHRGPHDHLFVALHIGVPQTHWRLVIYQSLSQALLSVQKSVLYGCGMILLAFLFLLFALKHLHKDVLGPLAQLQSSLKQAIHQGWTQDLPRLSSSVDTTGKYAEILSLRRLIGILVRMTSRHHRSHLRKMEAVQVQVVHSSKMASLGQMASGIAHEINNPLSILMVRLTQLQKEITLNNKDKSYELIEQMEKVIFRIAKIIQSLKTFSREASSDPFQDILVTDLIQETMTLCERRISNSQIKVQVNVMPPDLCVKGQSVPLSQVLINLLNNAYDAVMTSPNKWIRIEAERSKSGAILIKVIDSGPKISPEVTRRIMEPFFTTKDVGAGVGLGLSISKGIVESHGGRLYLDQQAPHTTFVIEL